MTDSDVPAITVTGDLSGATVISGRDFALLAVLREIAKQLANPHPFPYLVPLLLPESTPLDDAIAEFERAVTIPVQP